VALIGELAHVEVSPSELQGRVDRALLVLEGGARQVQVKGVGTRRVRGGDEAEPDLGVVARQQRTIALRHRLPTEQLAPEPRQPGGVLGVVRHGHES
jgi:hypothetical protein